MKDHKRIARFHDLEVYQITYVGLEMCRDIYMKHMVNCNINELVDIYDKAGRQLYIQCIGIH